LVDPHLYWQNSLNIIDVIRAVLGIFVVCLRYVMGTPAWRPAPVTGATNAMEAYSDTVGDATWRPLQGTWMVRDDPVTTLAEDHFCVWSWQLELLRTFAALLVLVSSFRLFEATPAPCPQPLRSRAVMLFPLALPRYSRTTQRQEC
jgi:hypothetical protein